MADKDKLIDWELIGGYAIWLTGIAVVAFIFVVVCYRIGAWLFVAPREA